MKQHLTETDILSCSEEKMKNGEPEWVFGLKILAPCPIPKTSAVTADAGGSQPSAIPIFIGAMIGALE